MCRLLLFLAIGALSVFGALPASAGALTAGTFSVALGTISPFVYAGVGLTGSASDTRPITIMLDAGTGFAGTSIPPITGQGATLEKLSVQITKHNAGTFTGTPRGGATATVFGTVINYGLGGNPLLGVPIRAGAGTTTTVTGGGFTVQLLGRSWSTGTQTITGLAFPPSQTTQMTTGSISVGAPGKASFVAATKVTVTGVAEIVTTSVARMELEFLRVPEPTAPLMLLAGAVALASFGSVRLRR